MVQTFVFESDKESGLSEHQSEQLIQLLRALSRDGTSFETLRIELRGSALPRIPLATTDPATAVPAASATPPSTQEASQHVAEEDDVPKEDTEGETAREPEEEQAESVPEIERRRQARQASDELPTMNSGTRRFTIAAILYHAEGYLTTGDIEELTAGEDWAMDQSQISTELYRMYGDFVVHRRENRGSGAYEYWLTNLGLEALEAAAAAIEPNPVAE